MTSALAVGGLALIWLLLALGHARRVVEGVGRAERTDSPAGPVRASSPSLYVDV